MREDHTTLTDVCPHCGQVGDAANPVTKQYAQGMFRGVSCRECVAAGKQDVYETQSAAGPDMVKKLRAVLAMTSSSVEHEAAAAMEHLQRLMTEHNLTIADLEQRGAKSKPGIKKAHFDLGKAAFRWKLDLASTIADHYFCVPLVDRYTKTVHFLGRPENVESLNMLYGWVIDQIKAISAEARRAHQQETSEHIDPLRWQLAFGSGVVSRLYTRLEEIKRTMSVGVTALVLSHKSEISDWMEENMGYRVDGQDTKAQRERRIRWDAEEKRIAELKASNPEAFYRERPWERPEEIEKRAKDREKEDRKYAAKQMRRRVAGLTGRSKKVDWVKLEQENTANRAGRERGDDINLQPFLKK